MGGFAQNFDSQVTPQAEGLPNIQSSIRTGAYSGWPQYTQNNTGALYYSGTYTGSYDDSDNAQLNLYNLKFDASRSNNIYGSSDHVTPVNYTIKVWLRTA